ncbi:MAG: ABC transporter permease [Erysipelotrichaceae bacterium]
MIKYLFKRLLHGLVSLVAVVMIVMILVYSLMDRTLIFSGDPLYSKQLNNNKTVYMYSRWEQYGYLDYVSYSDYLNGLVKSGELTEDDKAVAVKLARTSDKDSDETKKYTEMFTEYYESLGYTVTRLDAVMLANKVANGGQPQLFAYKDYSVLSRLFSYFTNVFQFDNIHAIENYPDERGLTFTLYDPVYGGEKFSPAIIGSGTKHRYLFYIDGEFPYVHQNFLTISLGTSYVVNKGIDVFDTMTNTQGAYRLVEQTYPSGLTEMTADNLHTATYAEGSLDKSAVFTTRFVDDYTNVTTFKQNMSKVGYSFVIGIIATIMAYLLGLPLGIIMAKNKDKLIDKIGTVYIIFIIAVPSLAYIFMFKAIGGALGLPTTFVMDTASKAMFILPIVSLALPSIANLMKWMRRYMIDQMNSDYVKFARSGGLTEGEIFTQHISKNAMIPIVHGIPGSILGALTGAIITERVYVVPGAGNLLTKAINAYDNGVIIGLVMFYALLSIISIILGDILMSLVDPRISFETKDR